MVRLRPKEEKEEEDVGEKRVQSTCESRPVRTDIKRAANRDELCEGGNISLGEQEFNQLRILSELARYE